ncbi:MAG: hypothetical protein M1833_006439 [Piccolia ochrophora]|nr:MAG: hypothetical protein M1833_006439 [Piccolia ochrophora]
MTTYKGHCHCGETEWEAKLSDNKHILCHCSACKLLSGAEYTLNQLVPKDDFKITKGSLNTYTYSGDSGNPVHCYYCPNCTTHAYHHQTVAGPVYVVRTGLLEGGDDFSVAAEIYGKERLSFQPELAQTFEAGPPG